MMEFHGKTANGRDPARLKWRFVFAMVRVITDREPWLDVYGERGKWRDGRGSAVPLGDGKEEFSKGLMDWCRKDQG